MPKPREGETEDEFVARCIPDVMAEGVEQEQAIAMCHSMHKEDKSEMSEKEKQETDEIKDEKCYANDVETGLYYTCATSFAEYDAQEVAEDAVGEIEEVTKLFGVMVQNIMMGYDVEDRVAAIQNLTNEYESRITGLLENGGIKEVDEPAEEPTVEQRQSWFDQIKSFFSGTKNLSVYQSGLRFTKGTDGKPWVLLWSTNAFIDRDREIFTTKSIDDFVERHEEDDIKGEVWFCHLPGSKFADIKMQARVGRFLLEAAPFDDTEMGQVFEKFFQEYPESNPILAPNGWGQSHGYQFRRKDRVDGVYTAFEKHESTILPWDIASNQHNPRPTFTREEDFMNEKQREAFESVFGKDIVAQMMSQGETKTAELEEIGVEYKAVEDATVEEEVVVEEKVVEEVVEAATEVEEVVEEVVEEPVVEVKETEEPQVTREEITEGLKVLAEEMMAQVQKMVDEKVSAAIDELIEVVVPLAKTVKALSESDETKIAKSVTEVPYSSLSAMIQSSIIGAKETHVDGRTSLAKDGPTEEETKSNGPTVAGVGLNLW